jgi:hypothetical protein
MRGKKLVAMIGPPSGKMENVTPPATLTGKPTLAIFRLETFRSSMKKIPTTDREAMAECLVRDEKRIKRMKPSAKRDAAKAEFERLSARFLEIYSRTHRDVSDNIQTGAE